MLNSISINTIYKHADQLLFNKTCWCVQEQYWYYLRGYNTGLYKKIIVEVNNAVYSIELDKVIKESAIDVVIIQRYFDMQFFWGLSNSQKKRSLLELLHESILHLAEVYNWDKSLLIAAYDQCLMNGLEYRFKVRGKNFASPKREFIAYVECFWDIDRFEATSFILRKDGHVLKKEKLMEIEPHMAEFIYYCNCKWDNDYTFSLYSKVGKRWSIAILSIA